jgi:hypothetical protein
LTSVITSCRTTTGGQQPKQTAAREAHWSAQAGPASYAIGALCSTSAAIPLPAIACSLEPPGEVMKDEAASPLRDPRQGRSGQPLVGLVRRPAGDQ